MYGAINCEIARQRSQHLVQLDRVRASLIRLPERKSPFDPRWNAR